MLRRVLVRTGVALSSILMGAMWVTALALSPWALGRMLTTVSLPRMREHRLRTTLTILGIGLGVSVSVSVLLVSGSIVRGVTTSVDDVAGKADLQIPGPLDEALIDEVRVVPGVHKVAPVVQQVVTLRTRQGRRERLLMLGVDMLGNDDSYFRDYESSELEEIRRDPLAFLNAPNNVILSRELAQRAGIRLHDKVTIGSGADAREFDVWGFTERGAAVNRAFGGAIGVMYYPAMQVAFDRGQNVDTIDIAVEPGGDVPSVARALKAAVGSSFAVERPAMRGERVARMLTTMRTGLMMSSAIAMFAGAFLVFNAIAISIVQRKRELAILRALGMTRRQQIKLLTLEGAVLGCVGSTLGIAGGLGLSRGMLELTSGAVNAVYLQHSVTDVHVDGWTAFAGFAVGLSFATAAALLAALSAGRIRAVSAFAASAPPLGPQRLFGMPELLGIALLAATLFLLQAPPIGQVPAGALVACLTLILAGRVLIPWCVRLTHAVVGAVAGRYLGVEAMLANDNLPRDLQRSASTASGLMAGVALTVGVATYITSFMTSLETWTAQIAPGDLFVTSGARLASLSGTNTPMSHSFRAELAALPEVDRVRRLRYIRTDYQDFPIKIEATDIRECVKRSRMVLLEGELDQVVNEVERGAVIISENFAQRFGVRRGESIMLGTREGHLPFPVAGVAIDYTSDGGTAILDWSTFVARWGDDRVDTYELHLRPGTNPETVRSAIVQRWGEARDLFVLTNREFRGEVIKSVNSIFSLMHALELVTLLVAALGIVTSVLANVLDRIREIGVLRALGMLRRQIRKIVISEAVLLGCVGVVAGLAVGLGLGHIVLRHVIGTQIGWHLPYQIPFRVIAELTLVTLPVAALAGFFPARHAASLVIADALDYE